MAVVVEAAVPDGALTGSLRDFRLLPGRELIKRTLPFFQWQDQRRQHALWPYSRATTSAPGARCEATSDSGERVSGVNFASQDYLGLSSHPGIKEAAIAAIHEFGVHSAGSPVLLGNTANSLKLERELSDFLDGREIVLYPTGWAAGYASVTGFVRAQDHVVMDVLAHSCLQEGARSATNNVHLHGHLNLDGLRRKLSRIRATDAQNGILVVTESLFSMDSDTPDIAAMRLLCDEYGAALLVDCAHDLGSMGENGLGHMGIQNQLHAADIIIGSFSKTFASNGGFIAMKDRASAEYVKCYSATHVFSNALSPVQAATISAALGIVRSAEGKGLRDRLFANILELRATLEQAGLDVLGTPSPIVPVRVGAESTARLASRELMRLGGMANLVEYPAVALNNARFRFQVMATHSSRDIRAIVAMLREALEASERAAESNDAQTLEVARHSSAA